MDSSRKTGWKLCFLSAADDEAELWLSTDDNTENLALIADRRQKAATESTPLAGTIQRRLTNQAVH